MEGNANPRQILNYVMKKKIKVLQCKYLAGFGGIAFAYGNTKIPRSTLIVNLTSAEHCPSRALGLCKIESVCYALKCERIYPNYKHKNLVMERWLTNARTTEIVSLMEAYIDNAPEPITLIRLDEAGDFRDQNQVRQWNKIARYFDMTRGIKTYTYTCRSDLDFRDAPYIVVNGSLPDIQGAAREYKCVPGVEYDNMAIGKGVYKCPGNCNGCSLCSTARFNGIIYSRQH